jgi:hypothetical protein
MRGPGIRASLRAPLLTCLVAAVALIAVGIAQAAAHNGISVRGPRHNPYHAYFNERVSGYAAGPANYVISGEQLRPAGGCAGTYTIEASRSDWYQWPTGTGPVHGAFHLVAQFYSQNHGKHGICSYLINRTTRATYAHASRFWTNA